MIEFSIMRSKTGGRQSAAGELTNCDVIFPNFAQTYRQSRTNVPPLAYKLLLEANRMWDDPAEIPVGPFHFAQLQQHHPSHRRMVLLNVRQEAIGLVLKLLIEIELRAYKPKSRICTFGLFEGWLRW